MWQPGPSISLSSSKVYSYTHKNNGLQLLLCPVEGADICAYMRAVSAGSKDESGSVPMGSAHFIEHMSFRIQKGKIWSLASKGDVINAETNMDSTRFFVVHLPHQTEETIRIDSERYKQAAVPADKVPVELHAVLNELERGQRAGNKMFQTTSAIGILEHPYHHSTIGTRFDVSSTTALDMEHFRAKFYVPNNTTLIFCGNFEPEAILKHVDMHFGSIPRAPEVKKELTPEPPQMGRRTAELNIQAQCPMICMAFRQPAGSTRESIVLQCISRLVWHRNRGRATQIINDGTVHDVSTYAPRQQNPYLWFMHGTLDDVKKLHTAEEKMLHVLQSFVTHAVSDEQLHDVKTSLLDDWSRSLESVTDMMNELGRGVSMGNWKDCADRRIALESIRAEDIQQVAQEVFQPHQMTVTRVIPADTPLKSLVPKSISAAPVETSPSVPASVMHQSGWNIIRESECTNILHAPRASYVRVTLSARFSPAQHDMATLFVGTMSAARNEPVLTNLHTERNFSHDHEFVHMTMELPTETSVLNKASEKYFHGQWKNPTLENVEIQKRHMIAEINASAKDQGYLTKSHFIQSLFDRTIYHIPNEVRVQRILNMTPSSLKSFHVKWIQQAPTMVTIVAPTVESATVVSHQLPKNTSVPDTTLHWSSKSRAPQQQHIKLEGYGSFQIMIGQTVGVKQYSRAAIALECATQILGGGMTGRLMNTVRVQRGLGTYGLYAIMQYVSPKTDGIFCIQGTFSPTSIHEGMAATKELLSAWKEHGVTLEELERAKEHMIGSRVIAMDSIDQLHGTVLQYLIHKKEPRQVMQEYKDTIQSLSLDEVNQTLRECININSMSEVVVGPTSI